MTRIGVSSLATKSEISKLIEAASNDYDRYRTTVKNCDKALKRLEPVYRQLGEIKRNFRVTKNSTVELIEEKRLWTGDRNTSFRNAGESLDSTYRAYYLALDAAQDAVNVKIGDLKAKKASLIPVIGKLWGQIKQWEVDFENAIN